MYMSLLQLEIYGIWGRLFEVRKSHFRKWSSYWQEIASRIEFEYNLNNVIVTCKCCHNDQMAPWIVQGRQHWPIGIIVSNSTVPPCSNLLKDSYFNMILDEQPHFWLLLFLLCNYLSCRTAVHCARRPFLSIHVETEQYGDYENVSACTRLY